MSTQLNQQPVVIESNIAPEPKPVNTTTEQWVEPLSGPHPTTFSINNGVEAEDEVYPYTPIRFTAEGYSYSPIQFAGR